MGNRKHYLLLSLSIAAISIFGPSLFAKEEPKVEALVLPRKFDFSCDSCRVALLSQTDLGTNFAAIQSKIKTAPNPAPYLEQLGWEYVKLARSQNDPGLYRMAEQLTRCWETNFPGTFEPLLIKGHVYQSLHQFKLAETIALKLVDGRGSPFDYGLLGDARYDLGKVGQAVEAYQKMMNLKPDAHAYLRVGQIRWIKGDLGGASEMYRMAVEASSTHDAEGAAWMRTRLASVYWQMSQTPDANSMLDEAIRLDPNHAAAHHLKGMMLLKEANVPGALSFLKKAAEIYPLPEYLWSLADAQRASNLEKEAQETEARIIKKGRSLDPRSCSLFLATHKIKAAEAIQLARAELVERQDIFSHDALAWALFSNGQSSEAKSEMTMALAENTIDARLAFHAALIFESDDENKAVKLGLIAGQMNGFLQPSERTLLDSFNRKFESRSPDKLSAKTN